MLNPFQVGTEKEPADLDRLYSSRALLLVEAGTGFTPRSIGCSDCDRLLLYCLDAAVLCASASRFTFPGHLSVVQRFHFGLRNNPLDGNLDALVSLLLAVWHD